MLTEPNQTNKYILSFFLILFFPVWGVTQALGDSLLQELNNAKDVKTQVILLNQLTTEFQFTNPVKAKQYALEAIKKGKQLGNSLEKIESKINLGGLYLREPNWDSVGIIATECLPLAKEINNKRQIANFYNLLGSQQQRANKNYIKAAEYYEKGYAIGKETKDSLKAIKMFGNNLGNVYDKQQKYDKAIDNYQKALYAAQALKDTITIGIVLNNIGIVQKNIGQIDKAIGSFQQAKEIRLKKGDKKGALYPSINLVDIYNVEKADFQLANQYALEGVALAREVKNPFFETAMLVNLAKSCMQLDNTIEAKKYLAQAKQLIDTKEIGGQPAFDYKQMVAKLALYDKDYPKALKIYQEFYPLLKKYQAISELQDTRLGLVNAHKGIGNIEKAFRFQSEYVIQQDSIATAERVSKLAEIEASLIDAENEKEIALLEKDQALTAVKITKTRTAAAGIAGLALLGFGFFWNARRKNSIITQQKNDLQNLNEMKDRILGILGHDLRKPVIALRGLSDKINYLIKKGDISRLQQIAVVLNKDSNAIYNTTDNLLHWALSQKNAVSYKPTQLDLYELVEETIAFFRHSIDNKVLDIQSTIPEETIIYADYNSVSTILRNILDNAIKYSKQGGLINFSANLDAEQVSIRIQDHGVGMDTATLEQITSNQAHQSSRGTQGERGTGLGMTLIKDLMHSNKGEMVINSQPNEGTTIQLLLPKVA